MAKIKKWTINIVDEEGEMDIDRTNDGFNAVELLGILSLMEADILAQMRGDISPVVTKRTKIED